jgi:predicted  nucleic acid-binding Zn-ribbon protein
MGRVTNTCVNNQTGHFTDRPHHCSECGKPGNNICLKKLHQAYCKECGRLFNVITRNGCDKHPYRAGFNKFAIEARKKKDPGFKSNDEEPEEPAQEEVQQEEERPWNTDWNRPEYKPKAEPKVKVKTTQGKKQQPAKSIKEALKERGR